MQLFHSMFTGPEVASLILFLNIHQTNAQWNKNPIQDWAIQG